MNSVTCLPTLIRWHDLHWYLTPSLENLVQNTSSPSLQPFGGVASCVQLPQESLLLLGKGRSAQIDRSTRWPHSSSTRFNSPRHSCTFTIFLLFDFAIPQPLATNVPPYRTLISAEFASVLAMVRIGLHELCKAMFACWEQCFAPTWWT